MAIAKREMQNKVAVSDTRGVRCECGQPATFYCNKAGLHRDSCGIPLCAACPCTRMHKPDLNYVRDEVGAANKSDPVAAEERLAEAVLAERRECLKIVTSSKTKLIAAARIKKRGT